MAGLVWGPGVGRAEPPCSHKILKISKKLLEKFANMDYFGDFSKEIKKAFVKFARFGRKT